MGAGPIGLACALMLAKLGIGSDLVDARSLEQARQDRRLLALSRGTVQLLRGLLGEPLVPMATISEVHVSSAGQFGATRLSSRDFDGAALGATIWYADLLQALARAVEGEPGVRVRRPCRVMDLEQRHQSVVVRLDHDGPIEACLAINAEGTASGGRSASTVAILANLDVRGLPPGTAVERFTRDGPLALLPVPPQSAAQSQAESKADCGGPLSMVWCLQRDVAQQRLAMDDSQFVAAVQATLGPRIGLVTGAGPRSQFPLMQQRRPRLREHRLAYIGNAAQSLHPVAGQGFNLGMRDCACLSQALARSPGDLLPALAHYEAARRLDRIAISGFTSWLPKLFSIQSAPIALVRSSALVAFDLAAPLRRELSRVLMFGLRG
jgi:2-octaprenyl-6-methoxyphenol hydroxylase